MTQLLACSVGCHCRRLGRRRRCFRSASISVQLCALRSSHVVLIALLKKRSSASVGQFSGFFSSFRPSFSATGIHLFVDPSIYPSVYPFPSFLARRTARSLARFLPLRSQQRQHSLASLRRLPLHIVEGAAHTRSLFSSFLSFSEADEPASSQKSRAASNSVRKQA